jgi:hypothetical protein
MPNTAISEWFQTRVKTERRLCIGSAVVISLASFIVLGFTFGVLYAGLSMYLSQSPRLLLILSMGGVALLFFLNARTDPTYLNDLSFSTGTFDNKIVRFGKYSNINPLAPDSAHSSIKIIASILFQGPRLATHAFKMASRANRLTQLNSNDCCTVLTFIMKSEQRTNFSTLRTQFPSLDISDELIADLRQIPGVVVLNSPEPGFTLTESLRDELKALQ